MKTHRTIWRAALAGAAMAALAVPAAMAQTTLKLAHVNPADWRVSQKGAAGDVFKNLVEAESGGRMKVQRQVHAADPEPPGGVGAAVVQPVAQGRVLDGGEGGEDPRLGIEGVQRRAERDQEPAGAAQRQRPQMVGVEGPLGVAAGRGIVAVQPRPLDVDPPQGAAAGTPDRRFPQQVQRLHDAAQAVGGGGAGSGCRPA